jgi:hypothetical protein
MSCRPGALSPVRRSLPYYDPSQPADDFFLPSGFRAIVLLLNAVLFGVGACNPGVAPAPTGTGEEASLPDLFQDVTRGSGLEFTYRNGQEAEHFAILESLGGGVALLDYDGDGLLDIFVTGGGYFAGAENKEIRGHHCKLYKNLGGWKFRDVTEEVGLDVLAGGQPWFYTHGCAVADYDRDGWPDLLVTGYGRVALFHNEPNGNGGRRFVDVTREAGLVRDHFWGTSAAWGDLDGDGWPDLYICQYVDWSFANNPLCKGYTTDIKRDVCPPRQFGAVQHAIYHNVAGPDGRRFVDVSGEAGLHVAPREDKDYGKGLGVLLVDVDGDGRPDIYVANDTSGNFLYLNKSVPGKLDLREVGFALGVARDGGGTPNGSMGVDAADYNGTGRPSIWVTNYEGENHALYRSRMLGEQLLFQYSSPAAGIAAIGQNYVGFGTAFVDVDNDGWEDLIISNGHVIRHPYRCGVRQKPVLLRNQGDGRFTVHTSAGGNYFRGEHCGRGLVVGDLDNDGRPDLVISHVNEPVTLLRNVSESGHHWLGVDLIGRDRRDTVGARLVLEAGGRKLTRYSKGGGSYLSSGDRRHLIGLGALTSAGRLTVEWPSGEPRVQHFEGLAVDRYYRIVQGDKTAYELPGCAREK